MERKQLQIGGTYETRNGAVNAKWLIDATKPIDLPFQQTVDVPEDIWRAVRLEEFFPAS